MKLITRDTDYAVRALCFIAKSKEKIVSVSTLVSRLRIPRPFLRQILQTLNKEGVLKSHKGANGGFQLAIAPRQIYVLDLIRVFQGQLRMNECIFKKKICPHKSECALRSRITGIEKGVISQLGSITIDSLLRS